MKSYKKTYKIHLKLGVMNNFFDIYHPPPKYIIFILIPNNEETF